MKYVLLVSVLVLGLIMAARSEAGAPPPQDAIRLDARITQLEQRLYTLETSLRNVEQQSRLAGMSQRGNDDVTLLRSELQTLQVRVMEDECALAKLDERTLTPTAREARKRAAGSDPCRLNFELPLRPQTR